MQEKIKGHDVYVEVVLFLKNKNETFSLLQRNA